MKTSILTKKRTTKPLKRQVLKSCVAYIRVSPGQDVENGCNHDFQKQAITEFAQSENVPVLAIFGGTYNCGSEEEKQERERMSKFISGNSGSISHLVIYAPSRLSRKFGEAMKLQNELRNTYGIVIQALNQG